MGESGGGRPISRLATAARMTSHNSNLDIPEDNSKSAAMRRAGAAFMPIIAVEQCVAV